MVVMVRLWQIGSQFLHATTYSIIDYKDDYYNFIPSVRFICMYTHHYSYRYSGHQVACLLALKCEVTQVIKTIVRHERRGLIVYLPLPEQRLLANSCLL